MRRMTVLLAATALLAAPASAIVPQAVESGTDVTDTQRDDDDGNSRLGLLGLLGLAGLLGLMRREPDIHVDARRDERK